MKILDVNVLMYATDAASAHHATARPWLADVLSTTETVGIPTAVAVGFVRVTTNARIMASPLDATASIAIVTGLLERPTVTTPAPTARHYEILDALLASTGSAGNLVTDAHLAALAIEHRAELWSYDTDFARFPELIWHSPASDRGRST